jgi:hypothetical protein
VRQAQLKLIVTAPGFATTEVEVSIPPRVTNHPVTVSMPLATIESPARNGLGNEGLRMITSCSVDPIASRLVSSSMRDGIQP